MRLVRFGPKGSEKPGLLDHNKIIDLRKIFPEIPDVSPIFFQDGWMKKISAISEEGEETDERLGPPIINPSKIICLGRNYAEHAAEGGANKPIRPLLFSKAPSALNGPYDPIILPKFSGQVDWEVELAVIIGKMGKRIAQENVFDYIAGLSVMNDVSGREAQFSDKQWFRGKSFDTFAPLGPAIVTLDEIGGPEHVSELRLSTLVDDQIMQDDYAGEMLFGIPEIIAFVSQDITLMPGDIISTGTPAGVGIFKKPPHLLKAGNIVECHIDQIGAIRNEVIEEMD